MESAGYHQGKLVHNIVAHMSGLPFPYPPQGPEYTPSPNPYPTIVPTVQPTTVSNVATDVSNIPPPATEQHASDAATADSDTRTSQLATEQIQGKPHKSLPDFAKKYLWTHGKYAHKGEATNNKAPKHQDTANFPNKRSEITYGCTSKGGSTSLMMPNIYHKTNILQQTSNCHFHFSRAGQQVERRSPTCQPHRHHIPPHNPLIHSQGNLHSAPRHSVSPHTAGGMFSLCFAKSFLRALTLFFLHYFLDGIGKTA